MDFQEERHLAQTFFMEISSQHLAHVPEGLWRMTMPQNHTWCFEVIPGQLEKYPYQFSLHFDQQNRVMTFSLLHQHVQSVRVFAHLYHRLIEFLAEHGMDCLVRNGDDCLVEVLYKNKGMPFHGTGGMSKQIVGLLSTVLAYVKQGKLYFWKEGHTVHLASPFISPMFWNIGFVFDESRKKAQGTLDVEGVAVRNHQDIHKLFAEVQEKVQQVLLLEQAIIKDVNQLATNSYYDPHSRSLMIFDKSVPFKVFLVRNRDSQKTYRYATKFGQREVETDDPKELLEKMKRVYEEYVKSERLHAALEGRA